MSIFDIPELASLVGPYLSLHALTQCVRVNKTWYALFIPFLWHTILPPPPPMKPSSTDSWYVYSFSSRCSRDAESLRLLVRQDYLSAQEHSPKGENGSDKPSSSVLSRLGPWIRKVSLKQEQFKGYVYKATVAVESSTSTNNSVATEPTEQELLLHLLKHCPNLQSLELENWRTTDADVEFWRTIARDVVPNLAEFGFDCPYRSLEDPDPTRDLAEAQIISSILAQCSSKMQRLRIPYTNQSSNTTKAPVEGKEGELTEESEVVEYDEELADGLKDLSISAIGDDRDWSNCSRFLRRCVHLESLKIETIDRGCIQDLRDCTRLKRLCIGTAVPDNLQSLADLFRSGGLPELDDIEIGSIEGEDTEHEDVIIDGLADMLSTCRKGWRSIDISILDALSTEALLNHCPTLESLRVKIAPTRASAHLRQILSSSPNLHTFAILVDEDGEQIPMVTHFLVKDFIDLDPVTNTLRPWPCESKLKHFSVKILGIPRPDVTRTHYGELFEELCEGYLDWIQETYPGQSQELQCQVYERLGRFKHLEYLGLGHDDRDFGDEFHYLEDDEGKITLLDSYYQYDCLDMSLGSGLWLLEGLKELQILNVMRMATSIGIEEVQWMAESWPKFELLNGLNTEGVEAEAGNWLKERGDALVGLRNLVIARNPKSGDYSGWSRFLKRWICLESLKVENIHPGWFKALGECTHIKRLHLVKAYRRYLQLLTHTLRTGLPNVDVIEIDHTEEEREDSVFLVFASLTDLLSACRKEWRSVAVLILDRLTVDALVKHFPTLESLKATITPGLMSAHLRQILSSSPNLHTLITLNDKETDFIDLDPATNALKPCPYESKLKHFSAKVLGIPRPDVTLTYYGRPFEEADVDMLQEIHFGQSRELRRRVYKRLSRLTQLEVLRLGHDDRDFKMNDDSVEYGEGQFIMDDKHYQYGCLEVSLDIGLRMLESLKELRVLNVMRMTTSTGVEEVRLMAENWPKLKEIHGLYPGGIELDAENWLWENCPRIDVTSYLLNNR
ncbi:hypothetical protein BGX33_009315 [Mortierella sp. NVP41]|nr:hypothetical protein BGX33_009315 [Mortierella sp. NVP41]